MSIQINGKPLNEYIKEQQKKDGIMIVHKGTTRSRFGASIYNGAIVTLMDDKDVRYENADISIRLNGKEYRLTGNLVERIKNVWYVDGQRADMPKNECQAHMADDIKEMQQKVSDSLNKSASDILKAYGIPDIDSIINRSGNPQGIFDVVNEVVEHKENVYGNHTTSENRRSHSGFNIKNDFTGGETIVHGSGTRTVTKGNRTVIKGGSVNINRGGKTYTIKGDIIEKINGRWYADGKAVEWNTIGGEYEENNIIGIQINGNVQNLVTTSGDVTVNGTVQIVNTTSGDVECETAAEVHTMSGDVHCKHIEGNVSTMSGDIYG